MHEGWGTCTQDGDIHVYTTAKVGASVPVIQNTRSTLGRIQIISILCCNAKHSLWINSHHGINIFHIYWSSTPFKFGSTIINILGLGSFQPMPSTRGAAFKFTCCNIRLYIFTPLPRSQSCSPFGGILVCQGLRLCIIHNLWNQATLHDAIQKNISPNRTSIYKEITPPTSTTARQPSEEQHVQQAMLVIPNVWRYLLNSDIPSREWVRAATWK